MSHVALFFGGIDEGVCVLPGPRRTPPLVLSARVSCPGSAGQLKGFHRLCRPPSSDNNLSRLTWLLQVIQTSLDSKPILAAS